MKRLGILGGGQLGRMLIQASLNYNIYTKVLDPDAEAPCHGLCNTFVQGSFDDYDTVVAFGQDVDILTVEIEHVNVAALRTLVQQGKQAFPQPDVLELIQDKGAQKQFYAKHQIPTAEFVLCTGLDEVKKYQGVFPVMQKLRRLGYDGKGVKKINSAKELAQAFTEPSLLEKCIQFTKELAVIVARNERGDITTYPTVEMKFHPEANLVEWLLAPARITAAVDKTAREIAMKIAEALQMVGVLAVEMFLTETGDILVNEIAPRPHNSGHHTIEGNITSQYDQHLRAIMNWPLGSTATRSPAVMINLIGNVGQLEAVLAVPGVYVHLYGKTVAKPFRKMGHITVLHDDVNQALQTALDIKTKVHL
ncbi:MAG: 5-(carboxyamino)imidazole ribonucleotide synthase [Candidatus Kerfeldbacteria bacterium]|nr:5-(carboxyamino)imidazole ribonucleotide synthase [Candidatus Kerfeldbacteria bacterium]